MTKKKSDNKKNDLRERAEEKLQSTLKELSHMSEVDIGKLVHELQVHQIELEMQNDELKKAHIEIEESKSKVEQTAKEYSDLFDFAPVGYFSLDKNGCILEANLTVADMLGDDRDLLSNKKIYNFIVDNDKDTLFLHLRKIFEKGESLSCELKLKRIDNSIFHALLESKYFQYKKDKQGCCRMTVTDISEIKEAEGVIKKSLHEKEILIQEIHHRVKNNLQIISSLLSLQSEQIDDERFKELFETSINRIHAMAKLHEQLYQSEDLSRISFPDFIKKLSNDLFDSCAGDQDRIKISIISEDIDIGLKRAVPLALILNELISNSLKHAFPGGREGEIKLDLSRDSEGNCILCIADNGIGMSEDFDYIRTQTLGLEIVDALVSQLKGNFQLDRSEWTRFVITFPE